MSSMLSDPCTDAALGKVIARTTSAIAGNLDSMATFLKACVKTFFETVPSSHKKVVLCLPLFVMNCRRIFFRVYGYILHFSD